MGPYNYIAIEGNIGVGKSSLAKRIAEDFSGRIILEQFSENPFLPKFYQDPKAYAFPLEMSFLAERFQQLSEKLLHPELFSNFVISDYFVLKSLIFAEVNLGEDEYQLYKRIFHLMYPQIPKPDLLVYLHRPTGQLQKQIRMRGRLYEMDIQVDYLERIQESYFRYLKQQKELSTVVLELGTENFMKDKETYRWIVDKLDGSFPKGMSVLSID